MACCKPWRQATLRPPLSTKACVAERQGAIYEHAQTLLVRGQVGRELGWSEADEDVASAKQILPTLEAAVGGTTR